MISKTNSEAKLAVTFPFPSAPLDTRRSAFKRTCHRLPAGTEARDVSEASSAARRETVGTGTSAVLFISFYFPAHSTGKASRSTCAL